jgi:hypothetical protein
LKLNGESARRAYRVLHARAGICVVVVIAAAGCAAVRTADGQRLPITSDRFADYAERVFREQNRVATELAFALEDVAPEEAAFDDLDAAEEALLAECAGLNEVAAATRDGGRLGTRRRLDAARQAPACERATAAASAALSRHGRSATADSSPVGQSGSSRPTPTR